MTDTTHLADRWRNRVALVTGASAGIGRAIARDLAIHAGMNVVAAARRLDRLQQLADEVQAAAAGGTILPVTVDLRDEASILAMFDRVRAEWSGTDVIVNNAGLGYESGLLDAPTAELREMLDINILALAICTREAVADMRRQQVDGHVIHVSSMSGHRVVGPGLYPATKYAVRAMTESLRQELRAIGSGIRVSSVSPGFVHTEFHDRYFGGADTAAEKLGTQDRLDPADVAEAVRWVLSRPPGMQVHDVLIRPTSQGS
ncbi:MAG: SDR family NAD(P)-dependent oxidoreductase [Planctomycetota bacterium]